MTFSNFSPIIPTDFWTKPRKVSAVSQLLKEKVVRGELGAKTGKGFFEYTPESLAKIIRERDRAFIQRLKEQYPGKK